jgi:hypothetical protein
MPPGVGVMAIVCAAGPSLWLEVGPRRIEMPAAKASASASSAAVPNRRAGSRSSARTNHPSNATGSPGSAADGTGAGAVQIFTSRSPTLSPSKGRTPVTHL